MQHQKALGIIQQIQNLGQKRQTSDTALRSGICALLSVGKDKLKHSRALLQVIQLLDSQKKV